MQYNSDQALLDIPHEEDLMCYYQIYLFEEKILIQQTEAAQKKHRIAAATSSYVTIQAKFPLCLLSWCWASPVTRKKKVWSEAISSL